MIRNSYGKITERQRRNMQFSEDRMELLDTIREMINMELDRREQIFVKRNRNHADHSCGEAYEKHPETPPPE